MKFHVEDSKVALMIQSCPAHPDVNNLKAIELVSLPKTNYGPGSHRSIESFLPHECCETPHQIHQSWWNIPKYQHSWNRARFGQVMIRLTSNIVKNCFRKADISPGNKGCKYRGWRWFIQNACRKCQWSRCLIDENLRLTITEHTFSSLYEWSTCYGRSRNSRFRFKWRLCRGGRGENDVPPEKPKYLRLQAL